MIDYYSRPELSQSDIKLINQSLLHYLSKGKMPCTDAMNIGKAFHTYILEPEKFDKEFAVKSLNLATKEGKEWKETVKDKIIIPNEEYEWFKVMGNRIKSDYKSFIFNNIKVEQEIYFAYQGVECRGKLDAVNHDLQTIIDLKTINSCSRAENEVRYNYDIQAAFYRQGMYELTGLWYDFIFVFAEKSFPHGVKFINTSQQTFESGLNKIKSGIERWKEYQNDPDMYVGYSEVFIEV